MKYDLIIIGAGPAGLTAGVYAARYKLKTLIIGELTGGLISEAYEVCNFPTYSKINGFELSQLMVKQVTNLGVEIKQEEVIEISGFTVKTNYGSYSAKKLIIATGTKRRKLNVKGESEFLGKGVSYCATCDAAFFKNKIVAVIGGSDASLTAALLLSEFASKVYIIYRKSEFFRAEPAWVEQVMSNDKIKPVFNVNVIEIKGSKFVEGVKLDDGSELSLDGVFIEIGSVPDLKLINNLGLKNDNGYIIVNKKQETNINGVYAAGDITNNPLKQAVTACAEGAVAANSVYESLKKSGVK